MIAMANMSSSLRSIGLRQKQPAPTKRIEAAPCVHPADALMKPLPAAVVHRRIQRRLLCGA
jgi:hypothetical protein